MVRSQDATEVLAAWVGQIRAWFPGAHEQQFLFYFSDHRLYPAAAIQGASTFIVALCLCLCSVRGPDH
jgi:hypothetical protein